MRRTLHASLLISAVAAGLCALTAGPAFAQMDQSDQSDASIGFDQFSDQLAPYGYWLYSDRWGLVWQPAEVSSDFRPYETAGHWVDTDDYGWYWQSEYPWGDIPFHYGRWVNDPDDGWLWIPGYVWSPGWVTWRSNDRYIGWMPMPPDEAFLEGRGDIGLGASFRFGLGEIGGLYGYGRWYGPEYGEDRFAQNWVFVGLGEITAPDYRAVAIDNPARIVNIIHQTRNITNYTVIGGHVVDRSIDVRVVERAAGHPIPVVRAATVIRHPNMVATVDVGQRVQMRMRAEAPHGTGIANSAPPPPPRVVAKLSTHVPATNGRAPTHLFTKATVAAPEAQSRFHGAPARAPGAEGAGGMTSPNGARPHEQPPSGTMGPNGERPHEEQPNGTTGPNGERPHEQPPNGTTGPSGERSHEEQPSARTEPNGERPREEQPNGMTGPNGERRREAQPNGAVSPGGEQPHEAAPAGANGATRPQGAARPQPPAPGSNAPPPRHPPKKEPPPNPPQ